MANKIDQIVGIKGWHEGGLIWIPLAVDADGNLSVASTATASELHIGQVGGESDMSLSAPTLEVAGAYSAGDAVGGIIEFTNVARVAGEGSVLKNLLIIDYAKQDAELELWLFDRTFTPATDNDAWDPSDADLAFLVAVISTADGSYFDATDNSVADVEASKRVEPLSTSLFGQLVTRGTPTYSDGDLALKLSYLQD